MFRRGAGRRNDAVCLATKQELLQNWSPAAGLVTLVTVIQPVNLDLLCFHSVKHADMGLKMIA